MWHMKNFFANVLTFYFPSTICISDQQTSYFRSQRCNHDAYSAYDSVVNVFDIFNFNKWYSGQKGQKM